MIERAIHSAQSEFYDRVGTAPGSDAFLAYVRSHRLDILAIGWHVGVTAVLPINRASWQPLRFRGRWRHRLRLRMLRGRRRDGDGSGCLATRCIGTSHDDVRSMRAAGPLASQCAWQPTSWAAPSFFTARRFSGYRQAATAPRSSIVTWPAASCSIFLAAYLLRTRYTVARLPRFFAPPLTSITRW